MKLSADLTGRRVLVTGASSGIGAATCRSIVGCGGSVAMLARRKERLDELHEELGDRAVGFPCDVTDLDGLHAAIDEAAQAFGGLDGVIAGAGKTMIGSLMTGTPERWRELVDLNLIGPLATVRYAVVHFPDNGRRDVVIVGSAGGVTPIPSLGVYAATKRGLRAAFDALRLELAPTGVNVSYLMPGMFDTEALTLEGLILDGENLAGESLSEMFVPGSVPAPPEALAEIIAFMISRPEGVSINELTVRPPGQLAP